MRIRLFLRGFGTVLLVLGTCSCSWLFTKGPPPDHEALAEFSCTERMVAPVLDVALGGITLWNGVEDAVRPGRDVEGLSDAGSLMVGGGWALLLGLSARSGYKRVKQCRAALNDLADRTDPSPGSSRGGPVGLAPRKPGVVVPDRAPWLWSTPRGPNVRRSVSCQHSLCEVARGYR